MMRPRMGAWGILTFENDPACDWGLELAETSGIDFLRDSLEQEEFEGYLEADGGSIIIAVGEVLYGIRFGPRPTVPEHVEHWIRAHQNLDITPIIPRCIEQMRRVMGKNSETRELWEESPELLAAWEADCQGLIERLRTVISA